VNPGRTGAEVQLKKKENTVLGGKGAATGLQKDAGPKMGGGVKRRNTWEKGQPRRYGVRQHYLPKGSEQDWWNAGEKESLALTVRLIVKKES